MSFPPSLQGDETLYEKKYLHFRKICYNNGHGRLAQLGERSLDVRKVAGSIPVPSIFCEWMYSNLECIFFYSPLLFGCYDVFSERYPMLHSVFGSFSTRFLTRL